MVLGQLLKRAFSGAIREVTQQTTVFQKLSVASRLSLVLLAELAGVVSTVPCGALALLLYSLLRLASRTRVFLRHCCRIWRRISRRVVPPRFWSRVVATVARIAAGLQRLSGLVKARGSFWSRVCPQLSAFRSLLRLARVHVVTDVRYGHRPRNIMDIYLPSFHHHRKHHHHHHHHHDRHPQHDNTAATVSENNSTSSSSTITRSSSSRSEGCRVVVFVHGGCWVSGDKWLYAPLAARSAAEGAIAVVIQYTLYPELLAEGQQEEAGAAFSWVCDNIHGYGGDPTRVFLCGHSSGSHTVAMLMWRRFKEGLLGAADAAGRAARAEGGRRQGEAGTVGGEKGGGSGTREAKEGAAYPDHHHIKSVNDDNLYHQPQQWGERQQFEGHRAITDTRQPYCVIALSGIFDLHYMHTYTVTTSTAPLTCFVEAVGGPAAFARGSPPNLFSALAEAVAAAGLETHATATGGAESVDTPSSDAALSLFFSEFGRQTGERIISGIVEGSIKPADFLPPMLLQCSPGDAYAPPHCSLTLEQALGRVGGRAKVAVYSSMHHAQFACLWKPWPQPKGLAEAEARARKRVGRVWCGDGLQRGDAWLGGEWLDWFCRCWGLGEAEKANQDMLDVVAGRVLLDDILQARCSF